MTAPRRPAAVAAWDRWAAQTGLVEPAARALPARKEWHPEADRGDPTDSSDYVDGCNDALDAAEQADLGDSKPVVARHLESRDFREVSKGLLDTITKSRLGRQQSQEHRVMGKKTERIRILEQQLNTNELLLADIAHQLGLALAAIKSQTALTSSNEPDESGRLIREIVAEFEVEGQGQGQGLTFVDVLRSVQEEILRLKGEDDSITLVRHIAEITGDLVEARGELSKTRTTLDRARASMQISGPDQDGEALLAQCQRWELVRHALNSKLAHWDSVHRSGDADRSIVAVVSDVLRSLIEVLNGRQD